MAAGWPERGRERERGRGGGGGGGERIAFMRAPFVFGGGGIVGVGV